MHVAIVGAGALGRVYGVRLAARAGAEVSFVVRPARVSEQGAFAIERATGAHERDALDAPRRVAAVPPGADVALLTVRADQLDPALLALLAAGAAPVVSLTPLLPAALDALSAALGPRLVIGQPGVAAYVNDAGVVRHWVPRSAPTLLDTEPAGASGVDALVAELARAGLPAHRAAGVRATNVATTITMLPVALGLHAAGSVHELQRDRARRRDTLAAVKEARALAARFGRPAPFVDLLAKFLGPLALDVGLGIARASAPEALHFAEAHFGAKVRAQNVAMGREVLALFQRERLGATAFARVLDAAERRA